MVLVLIEIFYILLLTCKEIQEVHLKTFHSTLFTLDHTPVFNRNSKGINNHRCNSNNHRSRPWKTISLKKETWQFRDLQSSFRPINPGKGTLLDSCLEFFVSLPNFPSKFTRKLMENNQPVYITQTQTYECHNQRATYKNFSVDYAVNVVNGIFALLVLMKIFYILSRVMKQEGSGRLPILCFSP